MRHFFAVSYTGNHNRQKKGWVAPRKSKKSRKRGKEVEYRGVSHEQVCVSTAKDRDGNLVILPVGTGRLTTNQLISNYQGKVEEHSIICTDSHNAYRKFATEVSAELVQVEKGKHKKGIYHINHINSLHNQLKLWFKTKYGVSTKYLKNYCYWFHWQGKQKDISANQKAEQTLYEAVFGLIDLSREDIKNAMPFAA